jgi:hypothetical protein
VLFNRFPIARGSGVYRGGFKDSRGHAVVERSVDDISVNQEMKKLELRKKLVLTCDLRSSLNQSCRRTCHPDGHRTHISRSRQLTKDTLM